MKPLFVLLAVGGLVAVVVLSLAWGEPWLWLHRSALVAAFDGQIDPADKTKYEFVCVGFDCDDLLPRLPAASEVSCSQSLVSDNLKPRYDVHIVGPGACCLVRFGDLGGAEVHIHRQLSKYKILLTEPRMREIASALAKRSQSG